MIMAGIRRWGWAALSLALVLAAGASYAADDLDKMLAEEGVRGKDVYLGSMKTPIEIHGYTSFEYEDDQRDGPKPTSQMDVDDVMLHFTAKPHDRLTIMAEVRFQEEPSLANKGDIGEFRIFNGYGSWRFQDWLSMKMGRFLIPIGYNDTVYYRPLRWLNKNAPVHDNTVFQRPLRDVGIEFSGEVPVPAVAPEGPMGISGPLAFDYRVGLMNGPQDDSTKPMSSDDEDNNSDKETYLRLDSKLGSWFELGGFYSRARIDNDDRNLLPQGGGGGGTNNTANSPKLFLHRKSLHGQLRLGDWMARSEYAETRADRKSATKGILKRNAWYFENKYRVLEGVEFWGGALPVHFLEPVYRFGALDADSTKSDIKDQRLHTLGLRWGWTPNFIVQGEYTWKDQRGAATGELHDDEIVFGATFTF